MFGKTECTWTSNCNQYKIISVMEIIKETEIWFSEIKDRMPQSGRECLPSMPDTLAFISNTAKEIFKKVKLIDASLGKLGIERKR